MGVLADVTVSPLAFPLGKLLKTEPVSRIEFESAVQFGPCTTQFCWIDSGRLDETLDGMRALDSVDAVLNYGSARGPWLVRVDWAADCSTPFVDLVSASDLVVLEAVGTKRLWSLRLRGPDDGSLRRLYDDCMSAGIQFEIDSLHANPGPVQDSVMTDKQLEAVTRAFEDGYFDIPRGTTLGALSEELDVSEQALSKLIRRGVRSVLAEQLSERR